MSLSGSLSNALSGLTVASRGSQVVSSNISNANTEGYGRRSLLVSAAATTGSGTGVRIDGVARDTDLVLLTDRRMSEAETALAQTRADALASIETIMGTPDEADSISGRITALETALVSSASRPDSETRLTGVLNATHSVVDSLNDAADAVQQLRMDADKAISHDVDALNATIAQVADLNDRIQKHSNSGYDINGLVDQRQVLIDQIAEIVPVQQLERSAGAVALYTSNGTALVDGKAAVFGFTPTPTITADLSVGGGHLQTLTLNGKPVSVSSPYGQMSGGRLEAMFEQRDVVAPEAQASLDALARNLIERFEATDVDGTGAGLFTDLGSALSITVPADEVGLAGRIEVNTNADTLWKLRSGLGAATAVPVGDSTNINNYANALSSVQVASSGPLSTQSHSAAGLATETLSLISVKAQTAEETASFAAARTTALRETELANGVDTDAELQDLLRYEEAYVANAKVISTVQKMLDALMEL